MRHVVVVGAGAELAQPLIRSFPPEDRITAVVRNTRPTAEHPGMTVREFGDGNRAEDDDPVDLLVVMAGTTDDARLDGMTLSQWRGVIETTLNAPAYALMMFLPSVKDGGNVVVVGSVTGSTGAYGAANYAAAKAGLVGLVRSAALEVARREVCVNLLELGFIDAGMGRRLPSSARVRVTNAIPLKRFGTEEDFVQAVHYLGSVRYMTGNTLTLAGGLQ